MRLLQVLLALVLLGFFIFFSGLENLLQALVSADLFYILLAVISYFIVNLLLAFRLKTALQKTGERAGFKQTFFAHIAAMFSADLTPAKLGYFSLPVFLHKTARVSRTKTTFSILTLAIPDFILKGIAVIAIVQLLAIQSLPQDQLFVVLLFPWLVILAILLFVSTDYWLRFFTWVPPLRALKEKGFWKLKKRGILLSSIIPTLLVWVFSAGLWYFTAQSLGIDQTIVESFIFPMVSSILFFVPIGISGLGIAEAATVFLLTALSGIALPQAAAFAVIWRGLMVLFDAIGYGIFVKLLKH